MQTALSSPSSNWIRLAFRKVSKFTKGSFACVIEIGTIDFLFFFLEKKNKNSHAKNSYPGSLLFLFLPMLMLDLDAVPHRPLCFDAWSWAAGAVLEARGLLEEWMTSCLLSASCLPVQWD